MIDIVIPYHQTGEDIELRYCLRSVEKYLSGVGKIFIIGDKPDWLQNVIHIRATDEPGYKWNNKNLYEKIRIACNDERISDNFLYLHDDHFLLRPYEADKFPYYCSKTWEGTGGYFHGTIRNTKMLLGECDNFDIHCPMVFNKLHFLKTFTGMDWTKEWGYCIKTFYAYYIGMIGEQITDCKIREGNPRPQIVGRPWFSTDDRNLGQQTVELLQELYPNKSKYEK